MHISVVGKKTVSLHWTRPYDLQKMEVASPIGL